MRAADEIFHYLASKLMKNSAALVIICIVTMSLTCRSIDPIPATTDDCGPVCVSGTPDDPIHYRLCFPNGGETLFVGDTIVLRVCSEDPGIFTFDDMVREISIDKGSTWMVFYTEDGLDTEPNEKHWIVPAEMEYIDLDGELKTASIVSDSVLLKVSVYSSAGDATVDYDISDGHIRIVK